jgi:hypothetical protein
LFFLKCWIEKAILRGKYDYQAELQFGLRAFSCYSCRNFLGAEGFNISVGVATIKAQKTRWSVSTAYFSRMAGQLSPHLPQSRVKSG